MKPTLSLVLLLVAAAPCGYAAPHRSPPPASAEPSGCSPARGAVRPTLGLSALPPFDADFWRAIDDLQVRWLRVDLYWRDVEPTKGRWTWSAQGRLSAWEST